MAQVPVNQKLWGMVVMQAKMKYHPYPSPGASAWVHKEYEEKGGKFVDSEELSKHKKLLSVQFKRHKEGLKTAKDNRHEKGKKMEHKKEDKRK
jgi:hypothetical protein